MSKPISSALQIRETTDFSKFELIEGNRPINWKKVQRMREAIRRKNLSSSYIILCNSKAASKRRYGASGIRYGVVDGQHRFLSLQLENKRMFYQVNDAATLDDIPLAATMQDSWKLTDYLHHYCVKGLSEYKAFNGYMIRNNFPPSSTLQILCGDRGSYARTRFITGEMEITSNWDFANRFADSIKQIGKLIKFSHQARFIEAFLMMFKNDDYDHSRMMARMEYMAGTMQRQHDTVHHLEQLEYVYNYKSRDKIDFS